MRDAGPSEGMHRWTRVAVALVLVVSAAAVGSFLLGDGGGPSSERGDVDDIPTASPTSARTASPTSTPTPAPTPRPPRNPWRSDPVVVSVENAADPDREYVPLVSQSVAYWNAHSGVHGTYAANYSLQPNASDPEITVRFVSDVGTCGHAYVESAIGCAPVLEADDYVRDTVTVRIEGDLNDTSTVSTLKHEMGHTLGLTHEYGDTLAFMNASGDASRRPMTDAVNKTNPWDADRLRVYVDYADAPRHERNEYEIEIREGLEYWNDGAEGYAPENVSLSVTRNESEADIVVGFAERIDTEDGTGYLVRRGGPDPDADGRIETVTHATVTISEAGDEDLIDWNVAAAVGYLFGDTEDGERAPPFDGDVEDPGEWTD